jgi:hypothetical protein
VPKILTPSAKKGGDKSMMSLLKGLKAENAKEYDKFLGHNSEEDDDDDVNEAVERRMSMNQSNMVGMNF